MPAIKTLVISLSSARERRDSVKQQLSGTQLDWRFLDAVVGRELPALPPQYDQTLRLRKFGYELTPGEIGCFLSHRSAWAECVAAGQSILVLEDDILLSSSPETLESLLLAIDQKTDIGLIRLSGVFQKSFQVIGHADDFELVKFSGDPAGTAAYLVKPSAAGSLLAHSNRFHTAVDDFMAREFEHGVKFLGALPYPVNTREVPSTIETRTKPQQSIFHKVTKAIYRTPDALAKQLHRLRNR